MDSADEDQKVLDVIIARGSVLTKEHDLSFFLYFKEKARAKEADQKIRAEWPFLRSVIEKNPDSSEWALAYRVMMVPELETLKALRRTFVATGARYELRLDRES